MSEKDNTKSSTEFNPTKLQIKFLEAYISSEEGNITAISKEAGVDRTTVYNWRKNPAYVDWFNAQVAFAMRADLPDIYKAIKRRAKRNYPDSKLYLERFDKDYSEKKKLDVEENVNINFVPADDKS